MQIVQKKAEDVLEYRFFIEDANNGVVVFDSGGIITDINDKFCNITGYSKNEILGGHISSFLGGKNKKRFIEILEKRNDNRKWNFELSCQTKTGVEIHFIVTILASCHLNDFREEFVAVLFDITHYKKVVKQLNRKEKELNLVTEKLENIKTTVNLLIENLYFLRKRKNPLSREDGSASQPGLTRSEFVIAELVSRGKTTKEIANNLCLSERTVSNHRQNIRRKMGLVKRKPANNRNCITINSLKTGAKNKA